MTIEEKIIIDFSKQTKKNRVVLDSLKRKFAKKELRGMSKNSHLLKVYHDLVKEKRLKKDLKIEEILRIRKIRSLSGIVIVSVLTKPYPCPGKCIFCPKQKDVPQSYLKEEPAVARAILCSYDPYKQTQTRIEALEKTGHPTDKIDLRIIGGTWSFYPKKYQTWFIKKCFEAANNKKANSLEKAQKMNETAKKRIIGITIETRPDYITKKEVKRLRNLGITRVELGIQSIYDDVLEKNKRGHGVEESIIATRLLKDAGFKICYQMMPNLLGSNKKRDLQMFKELFSNEAFQPDYLKIYPLALVKEAPLYKQYQKKQFKPYNKKELIELLKKIKETIPYYVRIQRIIRDIPTEYVIEGGVKTTNLRQIVQKEMEKPCKCIRCREVKEEYNPKEKIYLFKDRYNASKGEEIFLSYENKNRTKLYSLLRLRNPSQAIFPCLENTTIVRELHTYGQLIGFSKKVKAPQHKGLGKKLMKEAEKITKKEFKKNRIAVISGIGVRNYYRKLGYKLKDSYMIKKF
jgi:elongator complex protein 3